MKPESYVTKKYLARQLGPLVSLNRGLFRKNRMLIHKLNDAIYQHRYYMNTRGKETRLRTKYFKRLKILQNCYQRILNIARIKPYSTGKNRTRILKLTQSECQRLHFLLSGKVGLRIPYLSPTEIKTLKKLLEVFNANGSIETMGAGAGSDAGPGSDVRGVFHGRPAAEAVAVQGPRNIRQGQRAAAS